MRTHLHGDDALTKLAFYSETDESTGCRVWTAARSRDGYGLIRVPGIRDRRAHRVAYRTYVGDIPAGMHVLHKCDNPLCINPRHLFLGTNADNMRDKSAKGRHPNARFDAEQVRAIRESTDYWRVLAERYGVSISAIQQIKERRSYKHVT